MSTSRERGVEAGRLFSVLVVALLLFSSFAILTSSMVSSALGSGTDATRATDSYEYPVSGHSWDWAALAGEDGLVDVIVFSSSEEDHSTVERAMTSVAEALRTSESSALSDHASSFRSFGHSLDGFSASLDLDTIDSLLVAEPTLTVYPDLILNATLTDGIVRIGADQVWTMTDPHGDYVTGAGIVVAVIDTGIDYTHPDLGGGLGPSYKVIGGYDFVNDDADPMDDNGHGTHVAGTIAANGVILGVAPDAQLLAYKALGAGGAGSMSDVIEAIDAALDPNGDGSTADRADIISMSLGGAGGTDDPVCQAVERAVAEGVVVVVAAGNEGPSLGTVATPGLAPSAVTVGAVDNDGVLASFSSRGPTPEMNVKPEVSAPGVDVLSTVPYSGTSISSLSGYASLSGTSMATPHVSGSAALLIQLHPDWTPAMVKSAIVSGSMSLDESLWTAGAGEVWVPDAAEATMFSSEPLVSYGLAGGAQVTLTITNAGSSGTFSVSTTDWYSLLANGSLPGAVSTDMSGASPSSLSITSGGTGSVSLSVDSPSVSCEEGYYAGVLRLQSSSGDIGVPFGFVVLSTLNVHVYDPSGREVFDPYGGVWVYDIPDAQMAMGYRGETACVPPATFFLPSGSYAVHAFGHQLLYTYSDAYILSSTVTIGMLETVDLDIFMADANQMTLDLETEDGQPIYVKDFRVYCRYEGSRNISFDLTASDYSIVGPEVFAIPTSMTLYVSDTSAEIGISVAGFAYTPYMWEFMNLNWQHWYEYTSGTSTSFMVEASADLQYLLAWEYDGIDSSTPSTLTWDQGSCAVFETKYDIPGSLTDTWCNWGTHRAAGGDATFFVRRDTDTSLNPFFSGMTRTTIVSGVFSELYFPRSVLGGYSERQYFTADYDHVVKAAVASGIYLPDRNYIAPLEATYEEQTVGSGPYYPSLYMENTDEAMVLFHPLLRDQSGARVGGKNIPSLSLYKNGGLVGVYQLSEYLARPDAQRVVDLFGSGTYVASISYSPTSQVSSNVAIEMGFAVPSDDRDPPVVTGLEMSQRYVPGSAVPVSVDVADSMSSVTVELSWRAGASDTWKELSLTQSGITYSSSIQTTTSTTSVDLKVVVTDSYSNYMSATITAASLPEIPVVFELAPQSSSVEFRDASVAVVLEGVLTDEAGNPLSETAAVPIELYSGGEKVAMLLDEYILGSTHTHNGAILFQWLLNPTSLFTGTDQEIQVTATFDLGIYEPVTVSFTLKSVVSSAVAPTIELVSPDDGSLVAAGATIDLDIDDDGPVDVMYSLDWGSYVNLADPWDISTSSWGDGIHTLAVTVMDDDGFTVTASYSFDVDASAPELEFLQPMMGSLVPAGLEVIVDVYDRHLSSVTYSVDSSPYLALASPYTIDTVGWDMGAHAVIVEATDSVGHESSESVYFEIVGGTIVATLGSPEDGSYIQSGTPLQILVYSTGTATCSWSDGGPWAVLPYPYVISTEGWDEGAYDIFVEASDDEGGSCEFSFSVTVDDTLPVISLLWPSEGSYVTPEDVVSFQVTDVNLDYAVWSVSGISETTHSGTFTVSLSSVGTDGSFSLSVFAYDLAGNEAEDSVVFTMDLYDPIVGITDHESGDSVLPGEDLVLEAIDSHLKSVTLSVDGGAAVAGFPDMVMSTDALALGWHEFELTAVDMSGHVTVETVRIYIDGTVPEASITDAADFVAGEPLVVVATISDDFAVSGAAVYYELEEGGYAFVEMVFDGDALVATIPSIDVWDGMDIFVSVWDMAGNLGESEHVIARDAGASSDDSWISSAAGMAAIVAIAASLVVLAVFIMFRRRSGTDASAHASGSDDAPPAPPKVRADTHVHRATEQTGTRHRPTPSPVVSVENVRPPAYSRQTVFEQLPDMRASAGVAGPVTVSEAAVDQVHVVPADDEVDYGELIERELIKGVFERSVYRDAETGPVPDARVVLISPEERIISAMKLKRLMDGESVDDDSLF